MNEDKGFVGWDCPECGESNMDNFFWTALPMCEGCSKNFRWDELVTKAELAVLNDLLAEYEVENE